MTAKKGAGRRREPTPRPAIVVIEIGTPKLELLVPAIQRFLEAAELRQEMEARKAG